MMQVSAKTINTYRMEMSMFYKAAKIVKEHKEDLAKEVSNWVKENYPGRTKDYDKCARDLGHIINTLVYCLDDGDHVPVDYVARMFFDNWKLQLKSLHVEFEAYTLLGEKIKELTKDAEEGAGQHVKTALDKLKIYLDKGILTNSDERPLQVSDDGTRVKHVVYSWDEEKRIMENMQQCQRNWKLDYKIPPQAVDYLLWVARNAPTKQHEAYYDVYYSTDRETIDYLYQFSWGSTQSRNPPAMWRNSQMNANMYMIFVCKQPPTMYNCNNDGTDQNAFSESRWENSIVSVGMAMGLVMRAANKMGLRTGPNKVKDLGPDYDMEWEKQLGIYDDVKAGTKRLFFGLGIGMPRGDMYRWESVDTEMAIGASNGHHVSTTWRDPDWDPKTKNGKEKRKIDIIDIKDYKGEKLTDPYGNEHVIPDDHSIKINTPHLRDIKSIEIPKRSND